MDSRRLIRVICTLPRCMTESSARRFGQTHDAFPETKLCASSALLSWNGDLGFDAGLKNIASKPRNGDRRPAVLVDSVFLAVLAMLVGAIAAYAAIAFIFLIGVVQEFFYGFGHDHVYSGLSNVSSWRIVAAPALGGLLVGVLIYRFMPQGRNFGPADVMQAVREKDAKMSIGTGLGSAAVSILSIGAGASVGRYGPAVHLGASLSAWIGERFKLARSQRLALLGCGVAAAIAASFNAPLAGVLFAHEVVLGAYALRAFVPIIIASVTGTAVAHAHLGDISIFAMADYEIQFAHEYPLFAIVGLLGGGLAIAFMRGMDIATRMVRRSPIPPWARPMFGGFLLGLMALQFPQVIGLGDEAIHDAIGQLFPLWLLLALIAVKLLGTCISFAFGFSGGVFGPALFLGAMLGSAAGNTIVLFMPDLMSPPAIYAVAGMGAVISCVIGAPLATILIAFELTSSYSLTTAVMVAVVVAGMVTRRFHPRSYFEFQLEQRGVDLRIGREVRILQSRNISEVLRAECLTVMAGTRAEEIQAILLRENERELLVADQHGKLVGEITLLDAVKACQAGKGNTLASDLATMPDIILESDTSLHEAMEILSDFVGITVPVVDNRHHMKLLGIIFENAVIGAYNEAVEQARDEERGLA